MRAGTTRAAVAVLGALTLLVAGCGDDEPEGATATTVGGTETEGTAGGEEATGGAITVTVADDGIEVPAEVAGGAVTVTVEGGEDEVDFTRVEEGTEEDAFIEGMAGLIEGGPAPDFLLGNAGVSGGEEPSTILLEPGTYIVWTESGVADGLAPEGTPVLYTAPLTVTGEGGGELPETDGSFTAVDYDFEIDAAAGDTFTFRNEGPDQLHHVILFNFGDLEAAVVEENFLAFAQSDGEPPPAFAEVDFEALEAGGSGVFSPDGAGTFAGTLEPGITYVAACFINDLEGGPPHAIAYEMFETFTVD